MRCIVRKSDSLQDWWLIEQAEHDGREWMEPIHGMPNGMQFMRSARLGNADIEGTGYEMSEIAWAIERGQSEGFKRVSAEHTHAGYLLYSPRNSDEPILITHEDARALAADIRAKIGAVA